MAATLLSSELIYYAPVVRSSDGANGGLMSINQITSGGLHNLFDPVTESERTVGSVKYYKIFMKAASVASPPNNVLLNPIVYLDLTTPGEDRVVIFPATHDNTQADITGSENYYGAGLLDADIATGGTVLVVNVESGGGADVAFRDSAWIRITNKSNPAGAGNTQIVQLESSSGAAYSTDQVTLTLKAGSTFTSDFLASNTKVSSVITKDDNITASSGLDILPVGEVTGSTTASGSYDENFLYGDSIGTVFDSWTITFSDASNFTCVGSLSGSVGGGSTGSAFEPDNGDFSRPFFSIQPTFWSGTWANGDTISIDTRPAAIPVWMKRIVPAGSAATAGNQSRIATEGSSN